MSLGLWSRRRGRGDVSACSWFFSFFLPFQFPLNHHTHILLRFSYPKSRELTCIAWGFPDLYIFSSTLFCSILFFSFLFYRTVGEVLLASVRFLGFLIPQWPWPTGLIGKISSNMCPFYTDTKIHKVVSKGLQLKVSSTTPWAMFLQTRQPAGQPTGQPTGQPRYQNRVSP